MGKDDDKTKSSARAPVIKDVILVPNQPTEAGALDGVHFHNHQWGGQWKAKSSSDREVIKLAIDASLAAFKAAITNAAKLAKGRTIILLTGHGGTDENLLIGQTGFDSVPEGLHGTNNHGKMITEEVMKMPTIAEKVNGKWQVKPIKRGNVTVTEDKQFKDTIDRWLVVEHMETEFTTNGVSMFVILSCNVGNNSKFVAELAAKFGCKVRAYTNFVKTEEVLASGTQANINHKIKLWIDSKNSTRPTPLDPTDAMYTEVPTNSSIVKP